VEVNVFADPVLFFFPVWKERSIAAEAYSVAAKVFCNELECPHLFE
jgi:hypothetical protein